MKSNKAFTLIELLVVVLIIGILAGVALPQYQKAVTKTRYATLMHLTESIYEAEQVYHMANGTYGDFDVLDVDIPHNSSSAPTRRQINGDVFCTIELSTQYIYCHNSKYHLSYLRLFYNTNRYCIPYNNNAMATKICKQETNGATADASTGWYLYP
ncbi:type IV pilin protein [Candidatus Avelusimicrobium luingense]|uniref:type IV pilin protein n=1 Tax=Candidatus Avelusimicrobium luingense TaxID=3416211 RepID=UPI003D1336E0